MNHRRIVGLGCSIVALAGGCSTNSSSRLASDSGGDAGANAVAGDGGVEDGAQPVVDAAGGGVPPLCGSFALGPGSLYESGALHGAARTQVSEGSLISPTTFPTLSADSPLCVRGSVAEMSQGFAYAILYIDVGGVLRMPPPVDARPDADGMDAGGADEPVEARNAFVPTSEGLVVSVRNADNSPLWLCLGGANFDKWCVKQVGPSTFIPWASFLEQPGSGVAYANEPIVYIELTVPDPRPASSTAFDFCLDSLVEAAGWCGCPGGVCACPQGTAACDATCVPDMSTNPDDCGACGNVCSATSACNAGECRDTLVSGQPNPFAIAVDATNLYFTDPTAGTVMKAALDGDAPIALASGQMVPLAIALDATTVYWANQGTSANNYADGTIMKVALGGGTPVTLASGQIGITAIAVDAASVYWANAGTLANNYADGMIMQVALDGGTPVTLASAQTSPLAIAVDSVNVYWADMGTSFFGSLVDDGAVMKVPLGGGTPTALASAQPAPDNVAVDGTSVYWTTSGTVAKVPLSGGTAVTLASGQSEPNFMAIDGTSVYWTNVYGGSITGSVVKVPLGGGAAVVLASGDNYALGIAVDAANVYFTTDDGVAGGVLRISK